MSAVAVDRLVPPHGGTLVDRTGDRREGVDLLERVALSSREVSDLDMLAAGALSPLEGFMRRDDYERVVEEMRLANGLPWALPVCLAVQAPPKGDSVALADESGRLLAVLDVEDAYEYDKEREAERCFRTTDDAHPGVARLSSQHPYYVAGRVTVFDRPEPTFPDLALDPAETRGQCYRVLLDGYYPSGRVLLSAFPAAMRYAGPREAIWHAICRKNYGCSHFIVGRDHAGVGDYYGTYDAQLIFDDFESHELEIEPMFFEHSFYCRACGSMASAKTCPHDADEHVFLSGTKVREMLGRGDIPPEEFTRAEVAEVLIEAYRA